MSIITLSVLLLQTHHQLRATNVFSQFKDVLLRTRRVLYLYKVGGDSTLLVLNGTSLNTVNALLVLNQRHNHLVDRWTRLWYSNWVQRCSILNQKGRYRHTLCTAIVPFWFSMEHLSTALMPFWFSMEHLFNSVNALLALSRWNMGLT